MFTRAGAESASKAQALPKVRKEWLKESEDWRKGKDGTSDGVAQLRTMYLPRTDCWAESGRQRGQIRDRRAGRGQES